MRHDGRHLPLLHAALWRPTLTIAPCCATTANTYHCSTLRHDDRHLPLLHAASWRPTAALYTHIKQTESRIMKNSPPQSDRRHPLTEMTGLPEPSNDSACTSQHNSHVPWQLNTNISQPAFHSYFHTDTQRLSITAGKAAPVSLHTMQQLLGWLCGTVVKRWSLTGELSLSCARPAADGWSLMWVNRFYACLV